MKSTRLTELEPGDVAFYGVRPPWLRLWQQAIREDRRRYYVDNAYFDRGRETYFRVGVNALQSWSKRASDGKRLAKLGVRIQPWRTGGERIYVCPQSVEFMTTHFNRPDWIDETFAQLEQRTQRQAVLRLKRDGVPFWEILKDAWLVVAHSSSAAIEALLAGIPVIVTDPDCAAAEFGSTIDEIESPRCPDGREEWAARLADSQWTLDEFRSGAALKAITEAT